MINMNSFKTPTHKSYYLELEVQEKKLQTEKRYSELIGHYDNMLKSFDTREFFWEKLPRKAYCLLKLNKLEEYETVLDQYKRFGVFLDEDVFYRTTMLLHLAKSSDDQSGREMFLKTLRSWIEHPDYRKEVESVIFDFQDLIGSSQSSFENTTYKKNDSFSELLVKQVFSTMLSPAGFTFYYNKNLNKVQQEVEGHLVDVFSNDHEKVNEELHFKIINDHPTDHILEGVHYRIPNFYYVDFIEFIWSKSPRLTSGAYLNMFLSWFENRLLFLYKDRTDNLGDILFSDDVFNEFLSNLEDQFNAWGAEIQPILEIIEDAPLEFSLPWLIELNNR